MKRLSRFLLTLLIAIAAPATALAQQLGPPEDLPVRQAHLAVGAEQLDLLEEGARVTHAPLVAQGLPVGLEQRERLLDEQPALLYRSGDRSL